MIEKVRGWMVEGSSACEMGMFSEDHRIRFDIQESGNFLHVDSIGASSMENWPAELDIPIEVVIAVLKNAGVL